MRVPASSVFVALACTIAVSVGAFARSAAGGSEDTSTLPSDAERFGFVLRGRTGGDVALLEATRGFEVGLGNGPLRGGVPGDGPARQAARMLARELGRYPKAFLRRIRLNGVVLCAELTESGQPIPSLPNVGGLLVLDVEANEADLVRTLHHEVFHFADLADDGKLAPDPAWAGLNAREFHYGSGGRTLRGAWAARASDLPGFVSTYATSGVEEDKAETFAFAMARKTELQDRRRQDPVLAAKLGELERRIAALDPAAARILRD